MTKRRPFQPIGVSDARTLMQNKKLAIFDVRAREAFEAGRIGEAQHLTAVELSNAMASMPPTRPILIYCYHGFASREYAQIFSDFGFQEVYSLEGGFAQWSADPPQAAIP